MYFTIILGYLLSCVITYLIQRIYLKLDDNAWANPFHMLIPLIFIPVLGQIVSLMLLMDVMGNKNESKFKYTDFYRIK